MQIKHAVPKGEHLTIGESAQLIGVSVDTLKRWKKAGRIASLRTPTGPRRFRRSDVEALLSSGQHTGRTASCVDAA